MFTVIYYDDHRFARTFNTREHDGAFDGTKKSISELAYLGFLLELAGTNPRFQQRCDGVHHPDHFTAYSRPHRNAVIIRFHSRVHQGASARYGWIKNIFSKKIQQRPKL